MKSHDHTGRDSYIIPKALAYAIATIQNLPDGQQEFGDMADMCRLFRRLAPSAAAHFAASVVNHADLMPEIFADIEEDDEAGLAKWVSYRKTYQAECDNLAELRAEVAALNAKRSVNATLGEA